MQVMMSLCGFLIAGQNPGRIGEAKVRSGLSCQEPMGDAPGRVRADDVALSIDTLGRGG